VCILCQKRLRLSWKVDECKPLGSGSDVGVGGGGGGGSSGGSGRAPDNYLRRSERRASRRTAAAAAVKAATAVTPRRDRDRAPFVSGADAASASARRVRQGLPDIARHIIDTHLNSRFVISPASYDVASNVVQPLG